MSRVSHFGIEVSSAAEVKTWEKKLADLQMLDSVEEGVACCYAKQDKVWFTDPDGNA